MKYKKRLAFALIAFVVAAVSTSPAPATAASSGGPLPAESAQDTNEAERATESTVSVSCAGGYVSMGGTRSDTRCDEASSFVLDLLEGQSRLDLDVSGLRDLTITSSDPLVVTGQAELTGTLTVAASRLDMDANVSADVVVLEAKHQVTVSNSIVARTSINIDAEYIGVALLDSARLFAGESIAVAGANIVTGASIESSNIAIGTPARGETMIAGTVRAPGGTVSIDGRSVGLFSSDSNIGPGALVDVSDLSGGGKVFIGGDPDGDAASLVILDFDTVVLANAIDDGDGGDIRIWSDGATTSDATISATGGRRGGDGGNIEVSGRATSDAAGEIDVSATNGRDGSVLLDPLMFILFPAGVGVPLTAIDDTDAFLFKASPSPVIDSAVFVSQYFCDLAGLGSCGTPATPGLDEYKLRYWSTNTIIGLLTSKITNPVKKLRDRLQPLRVRGSVTFLQPITLMQFQGDITLEAIFGVNLLHGVIDLDELGIPSEYIPNGWLPDGELRLDNQGPGEVVRASTPSSVVVIGDIYTAGADIQLDAGLGISTEEIADWIDQITEAGGTFSQGELSGIDMITMITAAFLDTTEEDIQTMATELAEMVDLMCGGCVPDYNDELIAVIVPADGTNYDLSNVTAIPPLLDALGVAIPGWVDDLTTTLDDINYYIAWVPNGTDLVDAALGGIEIEVLGLPGVSEIFCNRGAGIWDGPDCWTTPPIPGIPGTTTSVCWGVQIGGTCYAAWDLPTPDVPGYVGLFGECGLINTDNGSCTLISGSSGTNIGFDTQCNLGAGFWHDGDCWTTPPIHGTAGVIENLCNLGTGFWQDGECWTIPPGIISIPGLNDADPSIPPTMAELISDVIAPLVAEGIWSLVDEASIAAGFGPAPATLPMPSFASNDLPSLLYVSGDLDSPGGRIELGNDSLGGLVTIADLISAGSVIVDADRSELRSARYDIGTVVSLAGLDGSLVGSDADGTLRGDTIDITVANGIGSSSAPISLQPDDTTLELDVYNDEGSVYLRFDRGGEITGSIETDGDAQIVIAGADIDLGSTLLSVGGNAAVFELDGSLILPDVTDAISVGVTGDSGDDSVTTSLYATGPVVVDGSGGVDVLNLELGGETPVQDLYGSLPVASTFGLTYSGIERITGLAPTNLDPVAANSVDEGSQWDVSISWIDWGAAAWTLNTDWGDGATSTDARLRDASEVDTRLLQQDLSKTFTDDGPMTVEIDVVDDQDGIGMLSSLTVEVNNVAPEVEASEDQFVEEGETVNVTATFGDPGADDIHTAVVNWGDGSTSAGIVTEDEGSTHGSLTAGHVYADNGVFNVSVCVFDDDGGVGCDAIVVTVDNTAPATEAGTDREIDEGEPFTLDPATFTDPGTLDTHAVTVAWGDGTVDLAEVTESPFGPPGTTAGLAGSAQASYAYADNGAYTVSVCTTDDDGGAACDSFETSVANVLPIVSDHATETEEGSEVILDAEVTDAGTADVVSGTIDWGDGSPVEDARLVAGEEPGTWMPTAPHTYVDNGDYTITLCVSDDDEPEVEVCASGPVSVANVAPSLRQGAVTDAIEGSATSTAIPFSDPGTNDTFTATIDWADGSAVQDAAIQLIGLEWRVQLPTHVYVQDGTFAATVCVTDNDGAQTCVESLFEVANGAPAGIVDAAQGSEGSTVMIGFRSSDPGAEDSLGATIDWGDGTTDQYDFPGTGGGSLTLGHVYGTEGLFTIEACVSDERGATSCAGSTATISNVAPALTVDHPVAVSEAESFATKVQVLDPGFDDTLTVDIDWGDDSSDSLAGSDVSVQHSYQDPGSYTIDVCASDEIETVCQASSIEVENSPLVLSFGLVQPSDNGAGVTLRGVTAFDAGRQTPVTVDWGDGSPIEILASGDVPTHEYANAGTYTIEICAQDDGGVSVCETRTFTAEKVTESIAAPINPIDGTSAGYSLWLLLVGAAGLAAAWLGWRRRSVAPGSAV